MRGTLLLLSLAVPASAQVAEPCADPAPSTVQVRRTDVVRLGWCHAASDDEGLPLPVGQVHFYLLNATTGVVLEDLGVLQPVAASTGSWYFESSTRSFAADVTLAVVAEYAGVSSPPSTALLVDVRGGPRAPTLPRVR